MTTSSRCCSGNNSTARSTRVATYPEDSLLGLLSRSTTTPRPQANVPDVLMLGNARGLSYMTTAEASMYSPYAGSRMNLIDILDEALSISEEIDLSTRSSD